MSYGRLGIANLPTGTAWFNIGRARKASSCALALKRNYELSSHVQQGYITGHHITGYFA